ncbi:MAG: hypothetical protein IJ880_09295 [Bacilli bacterium]|nr:hypothetical protein [Bacilli bacterium]
MRSEERLFEKYLSANGGNTESMKYIISRFENYIDYVSEGNDDLKHTIYASLFDIFENLDKRFGQYFVNINL